MYNKVFCPEKYAYISRQTLTNFNGKHRFIYQLQKCFLYRLCTQGQAQHEMPIIYKVFAIGKANRYTNDL